MLGWYVWMEEYYDKVTNMEGGHLYLIIDRNEKLFSLR